MNPKDLIDDDPKINRYIALAMFLLFLLLCHGIWTVSHNGPEYRARALEAIVEKDKPFRVQCGKDTYNAIFTVPDGNNTRILNTDYVEIKVVGTNCKRLP